MCEERELISGQKAIERMIIKQFQTREREREKEREIETIRRFDDTNAQTNKNRSKMNYEINDNRLCKKSRCGSIFISND
jgi:hypothetical protein